MGRFIPDEIVVDEEPEERPMGRLMRLKRFLRKLSLPTILKSKEDK